MRDENWRVRGVEPQGRGGIGGRAGRGFLTGMIGGGIEMARGGYGVARMISSGEAEGEREAVFRGWITGGRVAESKRGGVGEVSPRERGFDNTDSGGKQGGCSTTSSVVGEDGLREERREGDGACPSTGGLPSEKEGSKESSCIIISSSGRGGVPSC